nr:MAG TPA: hypothetical protein [Caudoviricetes sp.]
MKQVARLSNTNLLLCNRLMVRHHLFLSLCIYMKFQKDKHVKT